MSIKSLLHILAVILFAVLAKQFSYKKTDGFALYKILSSLPFNPEWEPSSPPTRLETEELLKTLDQPFYYLAKGAQSYVFVSKDGQTVIKFFRLYRLLPPAWMMALSFPIPLQPYKICKMLEKRKELDKDFISYKIAFDEMKQQTGLIYLHLNKTSHLKQKIRIYDKIGIAHLLDLDNMEFLVQKKACLVYPGIDSLMKTQGQSAAKEAISALVELLVFRCKKGIFDQDPDLNTNFGFLGKYPVQIDIGRFCREDGSKTPQQYEEEISRITDNFRQWLDAHYPVLSEHLKSQIEKIPALL